MSFRDVRYHTLFSAQATNGVSKKLHVADFDRIVIAVATQTSADLTLKCQGATTQTAPDFSSAASPTNLWDFIAMYDLEDATIKDGDTGVVYTASDEVQQFMINTEALTWLSFQVSNRTDGNVSVYVTTTNNQ